MQTKPQPANHPAKPESKLRRNLRIHQEHKQQDIQAAFAPSLPPGAPRPFAYGIGWYKLFWLFLIGSVLGTVVETIWCLLTKGHFEMRTGVVYGMLIPVYGLGAVAMTVCLRRLYRARDLWIFLGSAVIGGVVEYLCSLFQELAFHTVSWDYSHTQLNFGGRTNMMFSLMWGVLGIVWVKDWYPVLSKWIEKIPKKLGTILTWILFALVLFDCALSAAAVARKTARYYGEPASNAVETFLDTHFDDAYLDWIYPNMKFTR